MSEPSIILHDIADTQRFAKAMALAAIEGNLGTVLFKGTLGAGKTTIIRAIVQNLPGGGQAEVSSPSFTLMNMYATTPPVQHFDLYRLDPFIYDEALDEALEDEDTTVFVEWAERIPDNLLPQEYLECDITITCDDERSVLLKARGLQSQKVLQSVLRWYREDI